MKKIAFHWQILIAMVLGGALGLGLKAANVSPDNSVFQGLEVVGQLFMNGLKLMVVPLVVSSIIVGISSVSGGLGRLGRATAAYYAGSSLVAILIGLTVVNLIQPGIVDGQPARELLALPAETSEALAKVAGKSAADFAGIFLNLVPPNIVGAAAENNMLGLIVFSLLFAVFMSRLEGREREVQDAFWGGLQKVIIHITHFVLAFAPLGVFALIAATFFKTGFAAMEPLAWFFLSVLLALALHMFLATSLALALIAKVKPQLHLKAMLPALITAFSTASSTATLPVTLRSLRERAGVSERVSGMMAPLGASMNMDGSALYECAAALFLAQAYGLDLSLSQQFLIVALALLTSMGVAGIPAASLVAIAVILGAIGLPLEAIGLLLITDRLLDMCRTAVNVYSDSVAAIIVASLEGEALQPLRQGGPHAKAR